MALPRPQLVSLSDAVERLHEVEDELHQEAGRGEKELDKVQGRLALIESPDVALKPFAARASAVNKEHRFAVKQTISNSRLFLGWLYGTLLRRRSPLQDLESAIDQMSRTCRLASRLLVQVEAQYEQQIRLDAAISQRPRLVRQSLDGVASIMEELSDEANTIRTQFAGWRARFMIVFDPQSHRRAKAWINEQKINRRTLEIRAAPLFERVVTLCEQRKRLVSDIEVLSNAYARKWSRQRLNRVPVSDLQSVLDKFEGYRTRIATNVQQQGVALEEIQDILRLAGNSPAFLPGENGEEIPVAELRNITPCFEKLRFRTARATKVASSVVSDLQNDTYICMLPTQSRDAADRRLRLLEVR
ncbi:hypothetical protein C8Q76DRAFT_690296 [Earliella scabrosa]|nr:hypothetical protein C8Q76DRAFT_690296 [Earliella scabrosa]